MKKLLFMLMVTVLTVFGTLIAVLAFIDQNEEWLYDTFGKKNVRDFLKKFEPYITMTPDYEEEINVDIEVEDVAEMEDELPEGV